MPDFGRWGANGGDPSLNAIARTDRYLDALASEEPVYATDPADAELANLMAGWRDDVRRPPATGVATQRDAEVILQRAVAARGRTRMSMAVMGSVAAALLCLGGFGAVVYGAGPGDALYGLRVSVFGEQQVTRTDQVALASQQLAEVQQLIDEGQWEAAQDKLQTLTTTVATVNDVDQKQELVTQWQELTVKVESKDANATVPPGAPLPQMPDVPVVVAPGSDTSTTTSTETTTTSPSDTTTTSPTSSTETTTTPSTTPPVPQLPPTSSAQQPPPTSTPVPTPPPSTQTPLPTPPPQTPLPTPSAATPLPTPTAATPLPTPTAATPLPTPTTRVALPTPTVTPSEAEQEEPATTVVPPILEAPAPRVVTTTIVVPNAPDEPR